MWKVRPRDKKKDYFEKTSYTRLFFTPNRQEREKERRLEERGHGGKKSKLTRDRDRDVSELQALGKTNVSSKSGGEAMYDQRLFNQVSVWVGRVCVCVRVCVRVCALQNTLY